MSAIGSSICWRLAEPALTSSRRGLPQFAWNGMSSGTTGFGLMTPVATAAMSTGGSGGGRGDFFPTGRSPQALKRMVRRLREAPVLPPPDIEREEESSSEWIVRSPYQSIQIPSIPLPNFIWDANVRHRGDKVALTDGETGRSYTYSEASTSSRRLSTSLQHLGIGWRDVVSLFLENCPEYIISLTGITQFGATASPVNPLYSATELEAQLRASGARCVITKSAQLKTVKEAIKSTGRKIKVILVDGSEPGTLSYEVLVREGRAMHSNNPVIVDNRNVALLPYTSGTTGIPKGIMLTSKNVVANVCQAISWDELGFVEKATENFRPKTIAVLPMFHSFGCYASTFPTLRVGGEIVSMPKFEPKQFLELLQEHRPSFLHLSPHQINILADLEEVHSEHFASVKHIVVATAHFGLSLANKFRKKVPHVTYRQVWGMSETPLVTVLPSDESFSEGGGSSAPCGFLLPNTEAKIVDMENGESMGPYKCGELCVRGPQVMAGYFGNPEATERAYSAGGWLHSGDIAYFDHQGRFFVVDRIQELIKVAKGLHVAPRGLEDLLRTHPKVSDAGVIGVQVDENTEVPYAFVVKKPSLDEDSSPELTKEEVLKYMKDHSAELAGGVTFVAEIPRSVVGKVLRRSLREMHSMIVNSGIV